MTWCKLSQGRPGQEHRQGGERRAVGQDGFSSITEQDPHALPRHIALMPTGRASHGLEPRQWILPT